MVDKRRTMLPATVIAPTDSRLISTFCRVRVSIRFPSGHRGLMAAQSG
jgi:hypothetical protein